MTRVAVVGGWAPSLVKFRGPLLAALRARGHHVLAMAGEQDPATTTELGRMGIQFAPLPLERAGTDPRRDARLLAALAWQLRAHRIESVLAYTIKPVVYASLAARLVGVPRRAAMLTGLGYAFGEPRGLRHRAVGQVARHLLALALASCQTVLLQNPDDQQELTRRGLLPAGARVEITRGSGVDLAHYAPTPMPPGPLRFLFVGRLLAEKGIREFAAMARALRAEHPQAVFRVVGWVDSNPTSVTSAELEGWVREGVLEYAGALTDVRPELRAAHVLVLPSYREGTPRSVLEAMSMGRAVITTDAPGCRETVIHGDSGLLVPARDVGALVAAARSLLRDRSQVTRLAEAGRQRALALYDARAVAAHVLDAIGL